MISGLSTRRSSATAIDTFYGNTLSGYVQVLRHPMTYCIHLPVSSLVITYGQIHYRESHACAVLAVLCCDV